MTPQEWLVAYENGFREDGQFDANAYNAYPIIRELQDIANNEEKESNKQNEELEEANIEQLELIEAQGEALKALETSCRKALDVLRELQETETQLKKPKE